MRTMKHTMICITALLMAAGCSGSEGMAGASGADGADGLTSLVAASPEAAGENCAEGGQRIAFGADVDGNGELSEEEIEGSTYICNGEDGAPGEEGGTSLISTSEEAPGELCAFGGLRIDYGVDADGDGELDDEEITGTDYVCDGSDAPETLFEISVEPVGENCAAAGERVDVGRDVNRNGVLEEAEIESTSYLCMGVEGAEGPAGLNSRVLISDEPMGSNCLAGGQRVDVGLDQNANGVLEATEIDQTSYLCNAVVGVTLGSTPDPATVFDAPEECYFYQQNRTNSIWHQESNRLLTGHIGFLGYYSHLAGAGGYPGLPNTDASALYHRLVHAPATEVVVRTINGALAAPVGSISVGSIDDEGRLFGFQPAVFSDGFSGSCNLSSAGPSEFLCFDGSGIRHYETTWRSAELTFVKTVALSVPPSDLCDGPCFGGTFAWDGANYYFPESGSGRAGRGYRAYDRLGTLVGTYTADRLGNINATYFDWSIGRYATHDGYGDRLGTTNYTWTGGSTRDASQCYSGPSPYHVNAN